MEERGILLGPMMAQGGKRAARRKAGCPLCGARVEHEFRPFCSRRCADEDLTRWLGGAYRIPVDEVAGPEDAGAGEGPSGAGDGVSDDDGGR